MVQQYLLSSGQLEYVYHPVHFHDQQGSNPEHRIFGGMQRCYDGSEVLQQRRRHNGILREREATVGGMCRHQGRLSSRRSSCDRLHPAEPRSCERLFAIFDQQVGILKESLDCAFDLYMNFCFGQVDRDRHGESVGRVCRTGVFEELPK